MNAELLIQKTNRHFGIDITQKTRVRNYVYCRYAIAKIFREHGLRLEKIGNLINMHHTTVVYAIKEHDKLIKYDDYKTKYDAIKKNFPIENQKYCSETTFQVIKFSDNHS